MWTSSQQRSFAYFPLTELNRTWSGAFLSDQQQCPRSLIDCGHYSRLVSLWFRQFVHFVSDWTQLQWKFIYKRLLIFEKYNYQWHLEPVKYVSSRSVYHWVHVCFFTCSPFFLSFFQNETTSAFSFRKATKRLPSSRPHNQLNSTAIYFIASNRTAMTMEKVIQNKVHTLHCALPLRVAFASFGRRQFVRLTVDGQQDNRIRPDVELRSPV